MSERGAETRPGAKRGTPDVTRTLDIDDGDDIAPHLTGVDSGETVEVPPGNYAIGGRSTIEADGFELRGGGATLVPSETCRLDIVGDDWAVGGFRIDNDGSADVRWAPDGAGWRLHHLGWRNEQGLDAWRIYPSCPRGSTVSIEDCYFGPGASVASSAIFVYNDTDGTVDVRRCWLDQTGVYGVDTQRPPKMAGVTRFEDCFFRDSYLAAIRTGSNTQGLDGRVEGCVVVYTDDPERTPSSGWSDSSNLEGDKRSHRGVWAWWGHTEIVDTDITNPHGPGVVAYGGSDAHAGENGIDDAKADSVHVEGGNIDAKWPYSGHDNITRNGVGESPSTTPPANCPTSAAEAATGSTGTGR